MDPYLLITDAYGSTYKTQVKVDAGKFAVWNENLIIQVKDGRSTMLKVQLFDEDLISDSLIGEANFQV